MPTLITEKAFIDNLFLCENQSSNHKDLVEFIKNEFFGYKLVCDFANLEAYRKEAEANPLWELLMDKYQTIEFNVNLGTDVLLRQFNQQADEHNIFLLEIPTTACQTLQTENGYIYLSSEDLSHWETFRLHRSKKFKVTQSKDIPEPQRLDTWGKLSTFSIPLNSMVIFDKFIFGDKSNQKMQDNLFKIIDLFCSKSAIAKGLTLTIISDFNTDNDIRQSYAKVKAHLTKSKNTNIKVNVIKHNKAKYPTNFDGLHSRTIFTNYFLFKCDDSFNFFKPGGKINNDADLHVSFCLSKANACFYQKELNDIRKYVSRLENEVTLVTGISCIYYLPTKTNHLFN